MKVLVTGSTGFIGSHLCQALVEEGHEVLAFHRSTSTLRMLEGLDVQHAVGDLTRPETLAAALQGVEVVFHTAAMLGESDDPGRMYAVTVEGTRSLLQAAQQAGVRRVVHTSTAAALGVPEQSLLRPPVLALLDENHTWNFRSDYWPYAYSKYLAELEVENAVAQGLDVVIVNPTYVLGAGDIYRQASSIVVKAARGRLRSVVEGGLNVVHIDDVTAGHLAALRLGKSGERYLLGGWNLSVAEFLELMAAQLQVSPPVVDIPVRLMRAVTNPLSILQHFIDLPIPANLFHLAGYHFYYDLKKAQVALGVSPTHSVEEAITDAYQWFKETGAV